MTCCCLQAGVGHVGRDDVAVMVSPPDRYCTTSIKSHYRIFPLRSFSDSSPLWGKHTRRGEQHATRSVRTPPMETEPHRKPLTEIPLPEGQLSPGIVRVRNTVRSPHKGN